LTGTPRSALLEHEQPVHQLVFHSDGTLLATAASAEAGAGSARVWRTEDGAPAGPMIQQAAGITRVAFHPDGERLLTGSRDGSVRLWQIDSGQQLGEPMLHDKPVLDIAFNRTGSQLITAAGTQVRIWTTESGQPATANITLPAEARFCRFSARGSHVLVATRNGYFYRVEPDEAAIGPPWRVGNTSYQMSVFDVDRHELRTLAAGEEGVVRLSKRVRSSLPEGWAFRNAISDGSFSSDGQIALLSSYSGRVGLFSTSSGQALCTPLWHPEAVVSSSLSADNRFVATTCRDNLIRIWDLAYFQGEQQTIRHPATLLNASFSPTGDRLATATTEHNAVIWDANRKPPRPLLSLDHTEPVGLVTFASSNDRVVTATVTGTAYLWNAVSGEQITQLPMASDGVRVVLLQPSGDYVAAIGRSEQVHVWSLETGEQIFSSGSEGQLTTAISWHPGRPELLVVQAEAEAAVSTLVRFNAETGLPIGEPVQVAGYLRSAVHHPDGEHLLATVVTARSIEARLLRLDNGESTAQSISHRDPLEHIRLSPAGDVVASCSTAGVIRFWNSSDASPLSSEIPHATQIVDIQFSHDGSLLATASSKGIVRIYSSPSGLPVSMATDVGRQVQRLRFRPGSRELIALSGGTCHIIPLGDPAAGLEATDTPQLLNLITSHGLDDDGLLMPLASDGLLAAQAALRDSKAAVLQHSDSSLLAWHQQYGATVPAVYWQQRLDLLSADLADVERSYVRYSVLMSRAHAHIQLQDYDAAQADLLASHAAARPDFSIRTYSIPIFQQACLTAYLERTTEHSAALEAMITTLDPLNPYDAARIAIAQCLLPTDAEGPRLAASLAARSLQTNSRNMQAYLAFALALHRTEKHDQSLLVVTEALGRFPGRTQLHAALRVIGALAAEANGDTDSGRSQLAAAEELLAEFPAPATRRLGPNWHERLLIETLLSELDQTEPAQAPGSP